MCFYYSSLLFKSTTMYLPWFEKSGGQDKRTLSQHSEQLLFTLGTEKHPLNRKHVFLLRFTDYRANTHTWLHWLLVTIRFRTLTLETRRQAEYLIPGQAADGRAPWSASHLVSYMPSKGNTQQPRDSWHLMQALSCPPEDRECSLDSGALKSCSECSLFT